MFDLKTTTDLAILNALQKRFEACNKFGDNATRVENARDALLFATKCTLTDGQLLDFFGTTLDSVKKSAGEESIREHGLYRILAFSPNLSPVCRLFFDALMTLDYENALKLRPSV